MFLITITDKASGYSNVFVVTSSVKENIAIAVETVLWPWLKVPNKINSIIKRWE